MKHQIKNRFTDAVIFECAVPSDTSSGLATRYVLEKAVSSGANFREANLSGANLSGAYLSGANFSGANLSGANFSGANLSGANFREANLSGAYLSGAYLSGANFSGANFSGAKLIGQRPWFQIGPIGSRMDYLTAWITDKGLKIQTGCFFGTLDEFEANLSSTHQDNNHATEYTAAVSLIENHAVLWTPENP
jgi:uncharacterized protein YjbI with pentapeptide repeats